MTDDIDPDLLERELQAIANGERVVTTFPGDLEVMKDTPTELLLVSPNRNTNEWIRAENPMEWTL